MKFSNLRFYSKFVFRTPALFFSSKVVTAESIKKTARGQVFQEAIYFATPVLYDELLRWIEEKNKDEKEITKLIYSLNKYLSRMRSRCTPYGLFASCGTGTWAEGNNIVLSEKRKRITRLDMNFVCALSQHLAKLPSIEKQLLFFPNTSIYVLGNQLRYVEYKYANNRRVHTIACVDASDYLFNILNKASQGASLHNLICLLTSQRIGVEEANSFIHELIDCQLLVNELEPTITGENFIMQLLAFLNKIRGKRKDIEINALIAIFENTQTVLKQIDQKVGNEIEIYRDLLVSFEKLEVSLEENYLFQVDCFSDTATANIDKNVQRKILEVVNFLGKLNSPSTNKELKSFKSGFRERYEDCEMPLLEVLDTESGIGYSYRDTSGLNDTIDDLQVQNKNESLALKWNEGENFLLKKLIHALENENSIVKFRDEDIKIIPENMGQMAPTFSVMFKMINASQGKVQLNHIGGGSSAANFFGRFAYGDEKIHGIIKDISAFEQKLFGDKIIAEIVHLPESRIGNILMRPVLREYEIPYLAKSAAPIENQILLEDLFVSVKNNRIVLRSRRLNKEVIPRLSTAHNYSFNSLPVYKFLCDLQLQDIEKPALSFNWGALSHSFTFLPRAEYNDVVLFPATWNLSAPDFSELSKKISASTFMDEIKLWKEKWKMPRWIVLKDGDNELLVDFENELSVKTFFNEIKKRQSIQLSEFLFDPENALIKDEQGRPYTNEIIAIVFNHAYKSSGNNIAPEKTSEGNTMPVKRSFIPGSEWLYYKIYCGVKTADDLLRDTIKPIVENLLNNGLIEKWFFIRYSDPDIHIRLRFYNSDSSKLNEVMKLMNSSLQQMHEQGVISKIMTDTYNRELERYGRNSMKISERLFEIDSWATLNLLQLAQGGTADELKWQYAIKSLDSLMDCFGFDISRKLHLMEMLKTNFIAEHSTHKDLKIQLDNKFRKMRPQLNALFSNEKYPASEILKWNKATIQPYVDQILELEKQGEIMVNLNELIASYMHMSINRIFKSQQRKHEMVIYDQLYRYYKSKVAREKSK